MWNTFLTKKGEKMPTTESTVVKKLKTTVDAQGQQISSLQMRVSELVDTLVVLKKEIKDFKQTAAIDIKSLNDRIR